MNLCDRVDITSGDLVIYAEVKDYSVEHDLRSEEVSIERGTLILSGLSVSLRRKQAHGTTETVLVDTVGSVEFDDGCAVSEAICDALVEWELENNPVDWGLEREERIADDRLHMMREEGL